MPPRYSPPRGGGRVTWGASEFIKVHGAIVDRELRSLLRRRGGEPPGLLEAMSYSVFAGGKRFRPALVFAAARACGARPGWGARTAAALEMIHTYSLIHDDLPAMDDDDLRRGQPTNHKKYGEAMAILAGDGLLTDAFEALAEDALRSGLDARSAAELVRAVAAGAGSRGMVAGQAADLEAEGLGARPRRDAGRPGRAALAKRLEYIHLRKTAALLVASVEAGAILAKASPRQRAALRGYGRALGLAFQAADDVLDVVGDKAKLGKKGSDRENAKLTYASLYGVDAAAAKARAFAQEAHRHLKVFGRKAAILHELADYVVDRDY
ncbi:MAG: polyprenyl synthetase family protein [Elusimicrobia bacterium]|nr:polyprenyl synthetase family protein [Elusimicrobiota bacterium]